MSTWFSNASASVRRLWGWLTDASVLDIGQLAPKHVVDQRNRIAELEAELAEIRNELAGGDASSLPNDYSTIQMARTIRADRDRFIWQVRDTCKRAERAEAELAEARKDAERYRWLRGEAINYSERWSRWDLKRWDGRSWHSLEKAALDQAIDAALAKEHGV